MRRPPYPSAIFAGATGYTYQGGTVSGTVSPLVSYSGSYSSVKTPGFKALKPYNRPWNPYSARYTVITRKECELGGVHDGSSQGWPTVWAGWQGNLYDAYFAHTYKPSFPGFPTTLDCENDALGKLLDRMKDMKVNVAQAYAERKQTLSLISSAVNTIASAALAVRRGKLRHAHTLFGREVQKMRVRDIAPSPKNLSDRWLEFSYGWRPLLSDIHGAAEHLAKTFMDRKPDLRIVVTAKKNYTWFGRALNSNGFNRQFDTILDYTSDITVRYVIEYRVSSSIASQLASTGLTNPLLLAWELIPYSFVVDWFLPLGTYLNRLDATMGLDFHRGSKSIKHLHNRNAFLVGKPGVVYTHDDGKGTLSVRGGYMMSEETKSRTTLAGFPKPNPPALSLGPLGVSKTLSGLALLQQAFRR